MAVVRLKTASCEDFWRPPNRFIYLFAVRNRSHVPASGERTTYKKVEST
jgi:hypothetical protein